MSKTILLVGCGNMGFAMMQGWIAADPHTRVLVAEPTPMLRDRAATQGAKTAETVSALHGETPDVIVLAVKPQVVPIVAADCATFAASGAVVTSVAAGIAMSDISAELPEGTPVIRCMPNTPAAIGAGVMVLCANSVTTMEERRLVEGLFATSGVVVWLDEEAQMDAVTAISGSGPAYVFHFIEALESAGKMLGLPPDVASQLATQTVAGAGQLAAQSDIAPALSREQVTSPGGTTAAALDVLQNEGQLVQLVMDAATAARNRSIALGQSE